MTLTTEQRFELLALESNRQYAYAVVYGGLTPREASSFNTWVLRHHFGGDMPAENFALYLEESGS